MRPLYNRFVLINDMTATVNSFEQYENVGSNGWHKQVMNVELLANQTGFELVRQVLKEWPFAQVSILHNGISLETNFVNELIFYGGGTPTVRLETDGFFHFGSDESIPVNNDTNCLECLVYINGESIGCSNISFSMRPHETIDINIATFEALKTIDYFDLDVVFCYLDNSYSIHFRDTMLRSKSYTTDFNTMNYHFVAPSATIIQETVLTRYIVEKIKVNIKKDILQYDIKGDIAFEL